jgi:hypothetical protein
MDILTAHDLTRLADQRGGARISLFLPTHRGGPQTERNRIRLKNLLQQAQHALRTDGMRTGHIDLILEPGHHLLDHAGLWDQPSDGLALFLAPDGFRHLRVPLRLPELVTVGDRFVIRPLLPLLIAGGHFHVMALTQDEIRLFRGTRFALDQVQLDGLPLAVWLTMPRRQPQVHAFLADRGGAGCRAVFHGSGEDDTKPLVLRHFQRVDQALRELLDGDQAPLVLAGVRSLQAIYHQANTHPQLLATGVDGSPRDMSPDQLHHQVWPLVEPCCAATRPPPPARTASCRAPDAPAANQQRCSRRPNRDASRRCSCPPTPPSGAPVRTPGHWCASGTHPAQASDSTSPRWPPCATPAPCTPCRHHACPAPTRSPRPCGTDHRLTTGGPRDHTAPAEAARAGSPTAGNHDGRSLPAHTPAAGSGSSDA